MSRPTSFQTWLSGFLRSPVGIMPRERLELGLERRDDRLVDASGSGSSTRSRRELNSSWIAGIAALSVASAMAFQPPIISRLVGVGLGRGERHPDFGVGRPCAARRRPRPRRSPGSAGRRLRASVRPPAGRRRTAAACVALITATNRASATSSVPYGAAFQEREVQDLARTRRRCASAPRRSSCRRGTSRRCCCLR